MQHHLGNNSAQQQWTLGPLREGFNKWKKTCQNAENKQTFDWQRKMKIEMEIEWGKNSSKRWKWTNFWFDRGKKKEKLKLSEGKTRQNAENQQTSFPFGNQ